MTQHECTQLIAEKAKEIAEIYRSYNPNGAYLDIGFDVSNGYLTICNEYWDKDEATPLNYYELPKEE